MKMVRSWVYGPKNFKNVRARKTVRAFDDIAEPWRTYAMMLDAAADSEKLGMQASTPFGEKHVNTGQRESCKSTTTFYLFDADFWVEHGGIL